MSGIDYSSHAVNPLAQGTGAAIASAQASDVSFSFADFLDIVNPLQHIPVVSAIYRAISGDEIGTAEKIAGDTLYGGVLGFASSIADTVFKAVTGNYLGDTVLAFFTGGSEETAVAEAAPAKDGVASGPPAVLMPAGGGEDVATLGAASAAIAYGKAASLAMNAPTIH